MSLKVFKNRSVKASWSAKYIRIVFTESFSILGRSTYDIEVVTILKHGEVADKTKSGLQVLRLADLVDYQKGSVVSRTIVDKKAGTVTLFAFDKDEGLSEHTAPYDALVYLLDGVVEVKIEGKPFLLKEGEFLVMPARKQHALRAIERFKMVLIMVHA
jgi:quercetin dioxygenase-like cupin family protein